MDDSQLIIACKKQDRNAQKVLYERYAPVMMTVCLRYSKEEETARDLLHDGFIRAFTQIGSFRGKGSFEGWLRRIFVNLALENYRKEKQKNRFLEEYSLLKSADLEVPDDDPLDIGDIPREEVLEMIRELPPGYRTVFNLFIFEEMSHREIAEMLGIHEAASRSQFFRAKSLLQKKISAILHNCSSRYNEQR
ncbi:MAG: RNA polymerase sigma factor [bacterium]|jgi:RNA polymerase sigma-70 factor (ECF subfamily)|nr:RNA polymerase sigma factor [bacterium]MDD3624798.1 RNA polymerase sigma factor [Proteiniphilum sp.]MDD3967155.1 RNA polymerase sigma factor [Proteiniphilum sp.]MDD4459025.1 RNA polymerase sigma factor [Proteiniphilum sp.]